MKDPTRGMSKELRSLARKARREGWDIEKTKNNHYKWRPPDGGKVLYSSNSTSDHRVMRNLRAQLRRSGFSS